MPDRYLVIVLFRRVYMAATDGVI